MLDFVLCGFAEKVARNDFKERARSDAATFVGVKPDGKAATFGLECDARA